MKVTLTASGLDELKASLRAAGDAGPIAAKKVLADFTRRVVPQAKAAAPVDEGDAGGDLRDSIRATRPTVTKRGISAGVVAGGKALLRIPKDRDPGNYAVQQHEDMSLKHKRGGPKFIERPFFREAARVVAETTAELDRLLKK